MNDIEIARLKKQALEIGGDSLDLGDEVIFVARDISKQIDNSLFGPLNARYDFSEWVDATFTDETEKTKEYMSREHVLINFSNLWLVLTALESSNKFSFIGLNGSIKCRAVVVSGRKDENDSIEVFNHTALIIDSANHESLIRISINTGECIKGAVEPDQNKQMVSLTDAGNDSPLSSIYVRRIFETFRDIAYATGVEQIVYDEDGLTSLSFVIPDKPSCNSVYTFSISNEMYNATFD